jgi:hypothetical protein
MGKLDCHENAAKQGRKQLFCNALQTAAAQRRDGCQQKHAIVKRRSGAVADAPNKSADMAQTFTSHACSTSAADYQFGLVGKNCKRYFSQQRKQTNLNLWSIYKRLIALPKLEVCKLTIWKIGNFLADLWMPVQFKVSISF